MAALTCICGETMQAACEMPAGNTEGMVVLALCAMIAFWLARALGVCDGADYDSDDESPPSGMFT
jgi:hypothetical protein